MHYTQKKFVKMLAKESGYFQNAVKDVLDAIPAVVEQIMMEASEENEITIKVCEGLNFSSKYYPPKAGAMNPKTGAKGVSEEHIYPIAEFTQAYRYKIRKLHKEHNVDSE